MFGSFLWVHCSDCCDLQVQLSLLWWLCQFLCIYNFMLMLMFALWKCEILPHKKKKTRAAQKKGEMKTLSTLALWTLSLPIFFMQIMHNVWKEFCVDTRQSSIVSNWWKEPMAKNFKAVKKINENRVRLHQS